MRRDEFASQRRRLIADSAQNSNDHENSRSRAQALFVYTPGQTAATQLPSHTRSLLKSARPRALTSQGAQADDDDGKQNPSLGPSCFDI